MDYLHFLKRLPTQAVVYLRQRLSVLLGVSATLSLAVAPVAHSAERVEVFVGPFEPVIWVDDLEALAKDGTVTKRFRPFAKHLDEQQLQELQLFLNRPLDVDLITMSQFTYWQVGERFLERMGQLVQTDNFLNGFRALRAALIFAAADGEGVTVLEVLQQYPLDTVQLDFFLLRQILQENRRFFAEWDTVLAQLQTVDRQKTLPMSSDTSTLINSGTYPWQKESFTFQNPLREGDIPFDIYFPQQNTADNIPVIVFSHGVASGQNAFTYLAQHLTSHGYAVVVPQHYDDSQKYFQFLAGVGSPPNPITLISRPRDISFVLDELEELAQTRTEYTNLDLNNVGVLGHSLGGFTVLAAAGAELNFDQVEQHCSFEKRNRPSLNPSLLVQCDLLDLANEGPFELRDERIQAVFALNPPTSLFFGESGLAQLDIPTFLLASTADIIVPAIPEQVEPFQGLQTDDRYLAVVENATHFTFLAGDLSEGAIPLPSALLGPDPQQARPYLKSLSLAFFNRHLLDQTEADTFLSQSYLESLGTTPFQVTIFQNSNLIE
ncbi:MAG: alpha/beta hydrolase [Leptolyngbya sp. SIO3F4]|nr:alpha/beta hydrolase [Leptolyngbya sp. SIO3F4]